MVADFRFIEGRPLAANVCASSSPYCLRSGETPDPFADRRTFTAKVSQWAGVRFVIRVLLIGLCFPFHEIVENFLGVLAGRHSDGHFVPGLVREHEVPISGDDIEVELRHAERVVLRRPIFARLPPIQPTLIRQGEGAVARMPSSIMS